MSLDLRLAKELGISEGRRLTAVRANCAEIDVPASPAADMVYRNCRPAADLALSIGTLENAFQNPWQDCSLAAREPAPDQSPEVLAKGNLSILAFDCAVR